MTENEYIPRVSFKKPGDIFAVLDTKKSKERREQEATLFRYATY